MPNTMTTLCMEALRCDATKTGNFDRNPLILSNISQRLAKHSNPAKSLILSALTILNQQVAGSIPAGGSIYVPWNQSIMGTRPFGCAVELPRVGTQAGTQIGTQRFGFGGANRAN